MFINLLSYFILFIIFLWNFLTGENNTLFYVGIVVITVGILREMSSTFHYKMLNDKINAILYENVKLLEVLANMKTQTKENEYENNN